MRRQHHRFLPIPNNDPASRGEYTIVNTYMEMRFPWDPAKVERNQRDYGFCSRWLGKRSRTPNHIV